MVGFDKNRFIDMTESEKQMLSCQLCEAVLMNPKVMTCCLQTVCEQCIREWITDHKDCWFCARSLSHSSLSSAPLLITDQLNGFKIKCMFADNGCDSVVKVQEIAVHEIHCQFNPEMECIDCKAVGHEEHKCLSVLKFKFEKLEQNMKAINSKFIEKSALKSARDSLNSGEEFTVEEEKNIPQEMEKAIKEIVSNELLRISDGKEVTICENICKHLERLDAKKRWNTNLYMYGIGRELCYNYSATRSITLSIGSLIIHIFTVKK